MAELKERVEQYVAKRQEFQELEKLVMQGIHDAFEQEIPALSEKLPERYGEYISGLFKVRPPMNHIKMPFIAIPVLGYATYDLRGNLRPSPSSEEMSAFNARLAPDYLRFENEYGVIVLGFIYDKNGEL